MSQELLNENIKKAQEEIEKTKDKVSEGKMRQNYHFMAQQGWINAVSYTHLTLPTIYSV